MPLAFTPGAPSETAPPLPRTPICNQESLRGSATALKRDSNWAPLLDRRSPTWENRSFLKCWKLSKPTMWNVRLNGLPEGENPGGRGPKRHEFLETGIMRLGAGPLRKQLRQRKNNTWQLREQGAEESIWFPEMQCTTTGVTHKCGQFMGYQTSIYDK